MIAEKLGVLKVSALSTAPCSVVRDPGSSQVIVSRFLESLLEALSLLT